MERRVPARRDSIRLDPHRAGERRSCDSPAPCPALVWQRNGVWLQVVAVGVAAGALGGKRNGVDFRREAHCLARLARNHASDASTSKTNHLVSPNEAPHFAGNRLVHPNYPSAFARWNHIGLIHPARLASWWVVREYEALCFANNCIAKPYDANNFAGNSLAHAREAVCTASGNLQITKYPVTIA